MSLTGRGVHSITQLIGGLRRRNVPKKAPAGQRITIYYHLRRLEQAGLVKLLKHGRSTRISLTKVAKYSSTRCNIGRYFSHGSMRAPLPRKSELGAHAPHCEVRRIEPSCFDKFYSQITIIQTPCLARRQNRCHVQKTRSQTIERIPAGPPQSKP